MNQLNQIAFLMPSGRMDFVRNGYRWVILEQGAQYEAEKKKGEKEDKGLSHLGTTLTC